MNKWVSGIKAKGFKSFSRRNDRGAVSERAGQGLSRVVRRGIGENGCRSLRPLRPDDEGSRLHGGPAQDQVPDAERHAGPRSSGARKRKYEVYRQHVPHSEYIWYDGLPHNITDSVPERCAEDLLKFLLKHKGRA
jgi:hypothetical protein